MSGFRAWDDLDPGTLFCPFGEGAQRITSHEPSMTETQGTSEHCDLACGHWVIVSQLSLSAGGILELEE